MNILLKLREATEADHNKLDEIPLLKKLSNQSLSTSEYRELLQRFHCLHKLYEELLEQRKEEIFQFIPDLTDRMKTSWLIEDLRDLGEKPKVFDFKVNKMNYLAEYMGCLYVLEGSTLGRSHLKDPLVKSLPELQVLSNKFFTSYGKETGIKWKDFCNFLTEFEVSKHYDETSLIESAKNTFKSVRELFLIDDR